MIKRVNFTGRRRIPRNRVDIEVYDGNPRTFDAAIDLADIALPTDAAVFLEAMCAGSNVVLRFSCGEVGSLELPKRALLEKIEGENVFFSLKIVDRAEPYGRILGIADNIRPERAGKQTATGRRGILPIEPQDLGEELWRLEFGSNDVSLLIHSGVNGLVERARCDPLFYALVYPEVIRRVLAQAFTENVDVDDEDDRWPSIWLRFGRSLHPQREEPPTGNEQGDEQEEWIDEVVTAFCANHEMKSKFVTAISGGEGSEA